MLGIIIGSIVGATLIASVVFSISSVYVITEYKEKIVSLEEKLKINEKLLKESYEID